MINIDDIMWSRNLLYNSMFAYACVHQKGGGRITYGSSDPLSVGI
jgi:hypothetical protein